MKAKDCLYRIADLIAHNLDFDFFNWNKLSEEVEHLDFLDDHTLDMIQAQIVQTVSIRTDMNLIVDPFPAKENLIEVLNYLGLLIIKNAPDACRNSREGLEVDFENKSLLWGQDFHLLLTLILIFDKSGNSKLEKSVYMLADFAIRVLKESRDSNVT